MKRLTCALILVCLLVSYAPARAQDDPEVVGWLSIPSIWSYAKPISFTPVVNGDYDLTQLGDGITHLGGTTWIVDDWGRAVIAGHNPGAFSRIGEIAVGDLIEIHAVIDHQLVSVTYQISGVYPGVAIEDTGWLLPTDDPRLVLMACWDNERSRIVIEAVRSG